MAFFTFLTQFRVRFPCRGAQSSRINIVKYASRSVLALRGFQGSEGPRTYFWLRRLCLRDPLICESCFSFNYFQPCSFTVKYPGATPSSCSTGMTLETASVFPALTNSGITTSESSRKTCSPDYVETSTYAYEDFRDGRSSSGTDAKATSSTARGPESSS